MSTLFALFTAVAGQLTPVQAIDPRSWIGQDEYPPTALQGGERGYFVAHISVSADGSPTHCAPVQPSALSRAACAIIMKRARFHPARDLDGNPSSGLFTHQLLFRIPGRNLPPRPLGIVAQFTVDRLPEGARNPSYVRIAFDVNPRGQVQGCTPTRYEPNDPQDVILLLGKLACSQISDLKPPVARNERGEKITSIQSAVVRFDTVKPASAQK